MRARASRDSSRVEARWPTNQRGLNRLGQPIELRNKGYVRRAVRRGTRCSRNRRGAAGVAAEIINTTRQRRRPDRRRAANSSPSEDQSLRSWTAYVRTASRAALPRSSWSWPTGTLKRLAATARTPRAGADRPSSHQQVHGRSSQLPCGQGALNSEDKPAARAAGHPDAHRHLSERGCTPVVDKQFGNSERIDCDGEIQCGQDRYTAFRFTSRRRRYSRETA